jgi:hypothetical protein
VSRHGGGRSTEPIIAAGVVASCDVASGSRVLGGDVEGPVSQARMIPLPSEGCSSPRGATGLVVGDWRAARAAEAASAKGKTDHQAQATARVAEWGKSDKFHGRPNYSNSSRVGGPRAVLPPGVNPWRMAGPGTPRAGWCERPNKMVNVYTGEYYDSKCGTAKPSKCEPCAEVKRKDIRSIFLSGWTDKPTERGYVCTLTAPGVSKLPFDRSKCKHSPQLRCSGRDLGCVCQEKPLAKWHALLPARWNHFIADLRRLLNPGLKGPPSSWPITVEYCKTYEPQERKALHIHEMIRVWGVCTDDKFQAAYSEAAKRNDFGKQMQIEAVDLANPNTLAMVRKAGYCSKYASKNADLLPQVARTFPDGSEKLGGLRSWSASWNWGLRMWECQAKRTEWARGQLGVASDVGGADGAPASAAGALDLYQGIYATGNDDRVISASGWVTSAV